MKNPEDRGRDWFRHLPWSEKLWFHKTLQDGTYEWRRFFRVVPTVAFMSGVNAEYERWLPTARAMPKSRYVASKGD